MQALEHSCFIIVIQFSLGYCFNGVFCVDGILKWGDQGSCKVAAGGKDDCRKHHELEREDDGRGAGCTGNEGSRGGDDVVG